MVFVECVNENLFFCVCVAGTCLFVCENEKVVCVRLLFTQWQNREKSLIEKES